MKDIPVRLLDGKDGTLTIKGIGSPYLVDFYLGGAKEFPNLAKACKSLTNPDLGNPRAVYAIMDDRAVELVITQKEGVFGLQDIWEKSSLWRLFDRETDLNETILYMDGKIVEITIKKLLEKVVNAAPNHRQQLLKLLPQESLWEPSDFPVLLRSWWSNKEAMIFSEIAGVFRITTVEETMRQGLEEHFSRSEEQPRGF